MEDLEMDEAAMQQMMGFSNFNTTQRTPQHGKNKDNNNNKGRGQPGTGANSQPIRSRNVDSTNSSMAPLNAVAHPFHPASLPPLPTTQDQQARSDPSPSNNHPDTVNQDHSIDGEEQPNYTPLITHMENTNINPINESSISRSGQTSNNTHSNPHHHHSSIRRQPYRRNPDEIGWSHPISGISYTNRQLDELSSGKKVKTTLMNGGSEGEEKRDEHETTVYFRPEFVAEDIWADLERKAGLRT